MPVTETRYVPTWRIITAAILDFITIFFAGGYAVGWATGSLKPDGSGFDLSGMPAIVLFAVIIAYFVVSNRYLGGTLWQHILHSSRATTDV